MMDAGEQFAQQFLQAAPLALVYLAGIVACIICWRRSPRAAGFALAGLLVLLTGHVAGSVVTAWLIHNAGVNGNAANLGAMLSSLSLLRSAGFAAGMGALLIAVFIDRAPRLRDTETGD